MIEMFCGKYGPKIALNFTVEYSVDDEPSPELLDGLRQSIRRPKAAQHFQSRHPESQWQIMDREKFRKGINQFVRNEVIPTLADNEENRAERKLPKRLVYLSDYVSGLSKSEKDGLKMLIADAAHGAMFGLLDDSDPARVIGHPDEKTGFFEVIEADA